MYLLFLFRVLLFEWILFIAYWIWSQSFANNLIKFNRSNNLKFKIEMKMFKSLNVRCPSLSIRSTRKSYDSIKQSLCNENWFVWDFHNRSIRIMFTLNDRTNENNTISKMKLHFVLFCFFQIFFLSWSKCIRTND